MDSQSSMSREDDKTKTSICRTKTKAGLIRRRNTQAELKTKQSRSRALVLANRERRIHCLWAKWDVKRCLDKVSKAKERVNFLRKRIHQHLGKTSGNLWRLTEAKRNLPLCEEAFTEAMSCTVATGGDLWRLTEANRNLSLCEEAFAEAMTYMQSI